LRCGETGTNLKIAGLEIAKLGMAGMLVVVLGLAIAVVGLVLGVVQGHALGAMVGLSVGASIVVVAFLYSDDI
jgi:hypothetical protein